MKKNNFIYALLLTSIFILSMAGQALAWGTAGTDGSSYQGLQETAVFFNNSGTTLSSGNVVILDTYQTGVSTGTTLGSYVTTSTGAASAQADSVLAVGVVKSTSAADQTPVVVITKGVALTDCADSSDAITVRVAVGTSGLASSGHLCGGGTNLGIALESGDGTDSDSSFIWVDPTGAD